MSLKNVLIFGDSYSTFKGYNPEGYEVYYSEEEKLETDVRNVSETWWHQLICETDSNLVLNDSWSGSTICYTGYDNVDCSKSSSFIYRFNQLLQDGFFEQNKIDTVFVFGGTNDNCANAPIGSPMFSNWEKSDLYTVLPAISYFFNLLKTNLPDTRVVCVINSDLKQEIADGLKNTSVHFGFDAVELKNVDKKYNHPTIRGMIDIKNQILNKIIE